MAIILRTARLRLHNDWVHPIGGKGRPPLGDPGVGHTNRDRMRAQKIHRETLVVLFVAVSFLLLSGCTCTPILYEPKSDPSAPIRGLRITKEIYSLSDITKEGDLRDFGRGLCSNEKERGRAHQVLTLFNGEKGSTYLGVQYLFSLYCDEVGARREFTGYTSWDFIKEYYPVFVTEKSGDIDYMITYINRERADKEGFCAPLQLYIQRAQFRFRNVSVNLEVRDNRARSPFMAKAIEYLAHTLTQEGIAIKQQTEADNSSQLPVPPDRVCSR
jgi:hypothetical protein